MPLSQAVYKRESRATKSLWDIRFGYSVLASRCVSSFLLFLLDSCDLLLAESVVFERLSSIASVHFGRKDIVQPELAREDMLENMYILIGALDVMKAVQYMGRAETVRYLSFGVYRWASIQHSVANEADI